MCRSRRALDKNGADTAENEPLEDYRLIIQHFNSRRPKTQPYIGRSVAQPTLDYSRPWRPRTQPYIGRSEAQPAAFNRKC